MGSFGITEILLILVIVLVLFGGKKIPELAKGLGNGWREFRKASRDTEDESEKSDKPDKNTKQLQ